MAETGGSMQRPDIRVQRVEGDGVWARVSSTGEPGKRAFVLVSGIGVSSHYFEQLAPHLLQFGPVYALDLPGFGGVPHALRALSIGQFADLVGTAIDELGLDDPIVVGHSMGTQICTDLAASRPQISTLVLISPVIDAAARSTPVQAGRFLRASLHEPFRVKLLAVVAYLTCGFGWFFKILPRMMSYPIELTARGVGASTLIIRGGHDAVCPRPWATRLAGAFPHAADVVEIEGAAHSVMHAHAREVADLCVRHASGELGERPIGEDGAAGRGPRADRDAARGGPLTVVPELPRQEASLDPVDALRAVADEVEGVAIELKGNRTDDDHLVERGREQQAEARSRGRD
ncbi:alpha/beta fold hydrolase [Arthrobacter agilis]|uniref:alpha/beta fold hydrolase n=1 Tax=Arthrobacter agilis TaxID=37921 RepID=UPI001E3AACA9|nr:alpha/beta fold hydrolase [Arthrobacter agilis]